LFRARVAEEKGGQAAAQTAQFGGGQKQEAYDRALPQGAPPKRRADKPFQQQGSPDDTSGLDRDADEEPRPKI